MMEATAMHAMFVHTVVSLVTLAAAGPAGALKELLPETRVPDEGAELKPGDRPALMPGIVIGGLTPEACALLIETLRAKDNQGAAELAKSGQFRVIPNEATVLVLRPLGIAAEVRVLDGELRGQVLYVPDAFLVLMKEVPPPRRYLQRLPRGRTADKFFKKPQLDPAAIVDAGQAGAMLAEGKRLEGRGDLGGAIGAYWFTMIENPERKQAVEAARRLKAMGFYRTAKGYEFDPAKRERTAVKPAK
jgi:hypothetical protein